MGGCLKFIRWLLSIFITTLLLIVFLVGIPLSGVAKNITNKENVKRWIKDGKVYENADKVILDYINEKFQDEESLTEVPFTDEQLDSLAGEILTEIWLEENVDKFLDAVYLWLEGDTPGINVDFDVQTLKTNIINGVTGLFMEKAEALPECTDSYDINLYDPVNANCVPPGVTEDQLREQVKEHLEEQEVFSEGLFAEEEILLDDEANNLARSIYSNLKSLPTYVFITIIILAILLFLLIPGLKLSFLFTGSVLVISSILLLAGNSFMRSSFWNFLDSQLERIPQEQLNEAEKIIDLFREPVNIALLDSLAYVRQQSLIFVILGAVLIFGGILLMFSKRKYYVRDDFEDRETGTREDGLSTEATPVMSQKQEVTGQSASASNEDKVSQDSSSKQIV